MLDIKIKIQRSAIFSFTSISGGHPECREGIYFCPEAA
jgi:hypothetical protein